MFQPSDLSARLKYCLTIYKQAVCEFYKNLGFRFLKKVSQRSAQVLNSDSVFRALSPDLRGQHINIYSRVIHNQKKLNKNNRFRLV